MGFKRQAQDVTFPVDLDHLVKTVTLRDGRRYWHRCEREIYEMVASELEQHAERGISGPGAGVVDLLELPYTPVYVALSFLQERGCVIQRYRRNHPASGCLFEDAMIEYHALREKGPE